MTSSADLVGAGPLVVLIHAGIANRRGSPGAEPAVSGPVNQLVLEFSMHW